MPATTPRRIHATGLMPPSFGPAKAWCGRLVPIEQTLHHPPLNELCGGRGKVTCKTCVKKQR